jgi:RNA polymerase sigma-70 factor (ECF subfamily)
MDGQNMGELRRSNTRLFRTAEVRSIATREITQQPARYGVPERIDRSHRGAASGAEAWLARKESRMDASAKLLLFEETILPHLNSAYNLARWLTRNEDDAQDVVQEAYLRAFRFFDGFRGGDGKAWLLAVVRNTCLTWRRKGSNVTAIPFDETVHGSDRAANAEAGLVDEARLGTLRNCIESLPLEFREVIVMRELEELSYRDIADMASVPIGTVMSRLARARKRLQDCVTSRMKRNSV